MSTKTVISAAAIAVLALALGLAGTAGARSMELGDGAMFGDESTLRDIQETIWFQGFVGDAGTGEPVNATYTVTARMYDAESGGASVWGPETHVATTITDGWFNIELGNVIGGLPAFDTPPYYLQLTIDGELLSPRLKLASVPSAFQSLGADNGLNLPYSGTHGTSGNAFQITNTGPNICGYFLTNNAGSTAASLYGAHNGPGSAVLGWHTGTGPAIKGVANGSGYAGLFDGAVSVGDSLTVNGMLYARNNAIVPDTLMVGEGFWFAKNPVEGYVLRCADSWGNAEWGPPNVMDSNKSTGYADLSGGGYVNPTGAQVSLAVPGPGYIIVESRVWFALDHVAGTADKLRMMHSTSPSSFSGLNSDMFFWEDPAILGTTTDLDRTVHVSNTYEITSSGTYTYYLVAQMTSGASVDDGIPYAQTTGTYYPYPIITRAASDGGTGFPTTGDAAPH
ncbi:MAG: hypothetical protein ABIE42_05435 [Candidatus Eisenbacteria bacterium]